MAREILYFPPRPVNPKTGKPCGPDVGDAVYYEVCQHDATVAAYHSVYYRSIKAVVADLLERMERQEIEGPWGSDYVVWRSGRVMAVIHQKMTGKQTKVDLFREPRNDPGRPRPYPGWPTYEHWVASGRGPLWYDPSNPENPSG
jgi:hypothetical protein